MNTLDLCKYLISINEELIANTAIKDCHCLGLNSFIINKKPKIRLFIAEPNCELFGEFNYLNPIIPIHPHKYDDLFFQLEGELVHHLYELGGSIQFNKYKYLRLSDKNLKLKLEGEAMLRYKFGHPNLPKLKADQLHTVSLKGERCSWLIVETFEDKNFKQISYHKNLVVRDELYRPFPNSVHYLKSYFNL